MMSHFLNIFDVPTTPSLEQDWNFANNRNTLKT